MGTADGFEVTLVGLRAHAGSLQQVGAQVEQAQAAAATVVLARDAFGMICSFVPALFDPIQRAEADALAGTAASLRGTVDALDQAVAAYQAADQAMAASYDKVTAP